MKKLTIGGVGVLLAAAVVAAQNPTRLYTQPATPSPEVLDRLNLKLAWYTFLPTEGRRDGIFSVQIPERLQPPGGLLLVQTRSAVVLAIDGATGVTLWRTRVGTPYALRQGLGYNSHQIFVASGVELYALNRVTGQIEWIFTLPHTAAAPPVADEDNVYLALGTGRLFVYRLPKPGESASGTLVAGDQTRTAPAQAGTAASAPAGRTSISALGVSGQAVGSISAISSQGQSVRSIGPLSTAQEARSAGGGNGAQPQFAWDYVGESRLELAPLVTTEYLLVANYAGSFTALRKFDGIMQYHFQATAPLSAPLGQHNDKAYVGSQDFSVAALDIFAGRILWRFLGAGPIHQKPEVTDDSVYITPERSGLYRLDRESGQTLWRNPVAQRFLAANHKFVYATDLSGRLLILDRARGTVLAVQNTFRDYVVPITNDMTDRLYFASNDGLLLCLHDREYATPLRMKTVATLPSIAEIEAAKKTQAAGAGAEVRPAEPAPNREAPPDKGGERMPDK